MSERVSECSSEGRSSWISCWRRRALRICRNRADRIDDTVRGAEVTITTADDREHHAPRTGGVDGGADAARPPSGRSGNTWGPGGHRRASQRTAYYIYGLLLFMHHVCLYVVRVGADLFDLVGVDAGGGDTRD